MNDDRRRAELVRRIERRIDISDDINEHLHLSKRDGLNRHIVQAIIRNYIPALERVRLLLPDHVACEASAIYMAMESMSWSYDFLLEKAMEPDDETFLHLIASFSFLHIKTNANLLRTIRGMSDQVDGGVTPTPRWFDSRLLPKIHRLVVGYRVDCGEHVPHAEMQILSKLFLTENDPVQVLREIMAAKEDSDDESPHVYYEILNDLYECVEQCVRRDPVSREYFEMVGWEKLVYFWS